LTIESHGADIPHEDTAVTPWWKVLSEDISLEIIKQIISELLNIYDLEKAVLANGSSSHLKGSNQSFKNFK
jgi:hypothetical protein